MTDMHDDYLDHATTRLHAAVTAAGDEHDLWVAEVSKRARRYRLAARSAGHRADRAWTFARHVSYDRAELQRSWWIAKAEAFEALLRSADPS